MWENIYKIQRLCEEKHTVIQSEYEGAIKLNIKGNLLILGEYKIYHLFYAIPILAVKITSKQCECVNQSSNIDCIVVVFCIMYDMSS